jgi:hypothetical protein
MSKAIFQEKITVEVDGISYTGDRTIFGSRSLSQSVTYNGVEEKDGTSYTRAEKKMMDGIAQCILIQIVTERVMR